MKKIELVVFGLLLLAACAVVKPVPDSWRMEEKVSLKEGVTEKVFTSPQGEKGAIIYVREAPVYRQWQEKGQVFASVRAEDGRWVIGKPLPDYAPFDGEKIVFFLLIRGEPKKFEFLLN